MSGIPYNAKKFQVLKTYEFSRWFKKQSPLHQHNILRRLVHISEGHFGDVKSFDGLIELRWKNGIRMYGFIKDKKIFIVLIGGNKNGQQWDIKKAKKIKAEIINGTRSYLPSNS